MLQPRPVVIDYTNWKGVRRLRTVLPFSLSYKKSPWHPTAQWIMEAYDVEDDNKLKDFALMGIHSFEHVVETTPGNDYYERCAEYDELKRLGLMPKREEGA